MMKTGTQALVIDARKAFDSGVGSVIRNCVSELHRQGVMARVFSRSAEDREKLRGLCPDWEHTIVAAKEYSIREQWLIPRAIQGAALAWIPHYNIPLVTRTPLVTTVHDLMPLALPEYWPSLPMQAYANFMFRAAVTRSRRVVCVSEFTRNEIVRLLGLPGGNLRVVPNGVSEDWFEQAPAPRAGDPYLLFIGNVKPHKNLGRLLAAFAEVRQQIPHRLVLVGQSSGFITGDSSIMEQARAFGDQVHFTGAVSHTELRDWMHGASGFVFPSFYEGFGLPPLEAMAAGIPVAAAKVSSIPEVCGDCAIYFDPFEVKSIAGALLRLAHLSPQERDTMSAQGRERARQFSWRQTAHALLRVFAEASPGHFSQYANDRSFV